jgi:alkanesulfonate monooxygenase SsuD/methylene tetrahydromethanopterin reductase-like flavin-dependent oxidoreductase (luciferase family)
VTVQLVEKEEEANNAKVASTRGSASYVGTPEMVAEELRVLVEVGIDYFIVTIPRNAYDHEAQSRFAREVVPMFTR